MTNGLVVMTPTTVDRTGASSTATINSDGSVTFGLCETLSLNGVFTGDYDNYMVTVQGFGSASGITPFFYLRQSGVNSTTNFTRQRLFASGTSITGQRATGAPWLVFDSSLRDGSTTYVFGPNLSQPTAGRTVGVSAYLCLLYTSTSPRD